MTNQSAPGSRINTREVSGRRKVHYDTFQDLVEDAQRLAAGPTCNLGNWSLGQALKHLGLAMKGSIHGPTFKVPWYVRLLGIVYWRRRMVNGPWPAGLILPRSAAKRLVPDESTSNEEGLAALREGIEALGRHTERIAHPLAGKLTVDQWNRLHLRHAELHMSFFVPEE